MGSRLWLWWWVRVGTYPACFKAAKPACVWRVGTYISVSCLPDCLGAVLMCVVAWISRRTKYGCSNGVWSVVWSGLCLRTSLQPPMGLLLLDSAVCCDCLLLLSMHSCLKATGRASERVCRCVQLLPTCCRSDTGVVGRFHDKCVRAGRVPCAFLYWGVQVTQQLCAVCPAPCSTVHCERGRERGQRDLTTTQRYIHQAVFGTTDFLLCLVLPEPSCQHNVVCVVRVVCGVCGV